MLIGMPPAPKPASSPASGGAVYDATSADFETSVLKESLKRPVIIDFWAPWCGPCKQLGPLLEGAVNAQGGKVALAKVDIDQNPELAQAFRVQSIPMVVAMYQGQPVTAFAGARPKGDIDQLIAQLVQLAGQGGPDAIDIPAALKHGAELLEAGDLMGAQELYVAVLQENPNHAGGFAGLIRVLIAAGEYDRAQAMLDTAPEPVKKDPLYAAVKTALDLARNAPDDDLAVLRAKAEASPDDHAARYEYAEAAFAAGAKDEAADALLEIIRRDRKWDDEKARKQLLRYLEAWGFADPASQTARRKLSPLLFS